MNELIHRKLTRQLVANAVPTFSASKFPTGTMINIVSYPVADQAARLALNNALYDYVYQADIGITYKYQGSGDRTSNGSWFICCNGEYNSDYLSTGSAWEKVRELKKFIRALYTLNGAGTATMTVHESTFNQDPSFNRSGSGLWTIVFSSSYFQNITIATLSTYPYPISNTQGYAGFPVFYAGSKSALTLDGYVNMYILSTAEIRLVRSSTGVVIGDGTAGIQIVLTIELRDRES